MYIFLPDTNSSAAQLLETMNGDSWRRVVRSGFGERDGLLELPKFKLENTLELNATLKAMGIKSAFDIKSADFSVMFDNPHCLSEVRQKAFLELNEQGAEAAVVSGVSVSLGIPRPVPNVFKMIVNRPFLFFIADTRSEMILFMGLINEI